tara:strand:+ start:1046 stop:2215 length:1170 start_codon:yes stop_codon:yes gene_type:complete
MPEVNGKHFGYGPKGKKAAKRYAKKHGKTVKHRDNPGYYAEDKNWIQGAERSIERRGTEGKCTPITKPGCTGRAKALAKTFKKMAKKRRTNEGREIMKSREEITKEITTRRVQAGSPSKPVSKAEVAAERARQLAKIKDHVEYKRLGLYLAEAMGFRIDEFLPALAAGVGRVAAVAGRAAVGGAKNLGRVGARGVDVAKKKAVAMAKEKAIDKAKEKLTGAVEEAKTTKSRRVQAGPEGVAIGDDKAKKKAELKAQAASDDDLEEGKIMNSYVKKLMEWEAGPIAKRVASRSPAGAEGRMSDTKGKKISRDSVVDRETKKTQANVDKKLGAKTNLKVKDAVQGSMNRRRARFKKGKSVEGSPTIAPSTKKDSAADAARDSWRRMAPGDK